MFSGIDSAYHEGYEAYRTGETTHEDCPYTIDCPAYEAWTRGWDDAHADANVCPEYWG